MAKESVEVVIEGFSGPLDMLCHLVDSRQMQASKIKMTQLVRIYGAYLSKTKKASVETLAEFFFMAASLLLQKTLSILPADSSAEDSELLDEAAEMDEQALEEEMFERIARYRPYLTARSWMEERKAGREKSYRRAAEEQGEEGEPRYDIGNLYFLCRVWWGLLERRSARSSSFSLSLPPDSDFGEEEGWDGMPSALPEESQIQGRIAELEEKLALHAELSLNALWALTPTVQALVVTILAVLEMCRMGKTVIEQEVPFSDVKIRAKN
ncbi:MAG: segregation/condensation protein A [Synergistaceae bacterium]|nr:segregation/condensation protein A [Synergistaceae bacterium]